MPRRTQQGAAAVALVVLAAACTGGPARREPSAVTTGPAPGTTTSAAAASPTTASCPDQRVEAARAYLVERFGYDPDDVVVLGVESVVWPDAALGCPVTGQSYEPGPVTGYRIVLGWRDVEFRFHGADGEPPFPCEYLD